MKILIVFMGFFFFHLSAHVTHILYVPRAAPFFHSRLIFAHPMRGLLCMKILACCYFHHVLVNSDEKYTVHETQVQLVLAC